MKAPTFWVPGTKHSTPAVIAARTLQRISLYRWERLGTWDASVDGRRNNSRVNSFSAKCPIKEQKISKPRLSDKGSMETSWVDTVSLGSFQLRSRDFRVQRNFWETRRQRLNYTEIEFSIELQRSCHDQGSFVPFPFVLHFPSPLSPSFPPPPVSLFPPSSLIPISLSSSWSSLVSSSPSSLLLGFQEKELN